MYMILSKIHEKLAQTECPILELQMTCYYRHNTLQPNQMSFYYRHNTLQPNQMSFYYRHSTLQPNQMSFYYRHNTLQPDVVDTNSLIWTFCKEFYHLPSTLATYYSGSYQQSPTCWWAS